MATSFWNSWQLWEKLCFILGCAIVFVIILGCLKLIYNHRKLRKYTKIDATKALIRQEMKQSQSVRRGRAVQVPFGVRALESGIEVDGVWISKSNTPVGSLPGSPALSGTVFKQTAPHLDDSLRRPSTGSDMTRMEISQPVHGYPEADYSPSSSSSMTNPFDRSVNSHEQSPVSDYQSSGRPTYQPRRSSGLRFSNSFNPEDPETLSVPETHSIPSRKDGKRPEGFEPDTEERIPSTSASSSSNDSGVGSSAQKSKVEATGNGFLHPRYHNPPKGYAPVTYELFNIGSSAPSQSSRVGDKSKIHASNPIHGNIDLDSQVDNVTVGGITRSSKESSNPFLTPDGSVKDYPAESFHVDNDIADQHARLMDNNEVFREQDQTQVSQPFDGNRRLRRSQVIRKINSGFEILRPGTLEFARQKDDAAMNGDLEGASKRESKKLQKRGRASSRSSYTLEA